MPSGRIITFYSFKGGVGRTFSLANCAFHWALAGRRVLVIDWDLTSPGLHHYLRPFLDRESPQEGGVIDYFSSIEAGMDLLGDAVRSMSELHDAGDMEGSRRVFDENFDPSAFIATADLLPVGSELRAGEDPTLDGALSDARLDVMTAGRQDELYAARVSRFDWNRFSASIDGRFILEQFRDWTTRNYDVVLIDSRTGFDDIPALCTRLLPDMVTMWFAPNRQNVEGTVEMAELLATIDENSFGPRGRPVLFPVPTRIDGSEDCGDAIAYAARRLSTVLRRKELVLRAQLNEVAIPVVPGMQSTERLAWPTRPTVSGELVEQFATIVARIEDALGLPPAQLFPELTASTAYRTWYDDQLRMSDPRVHEVERLVEGGDTQQVMLFLEQVVLEAASEEGRRARTSLREGCVEIQTLLRIQARALQAIAFAEGKDEVLVSLVVPDIIFRVIALADEIAASDRAIEQDFSLGATGDLVIAGLALHGRSEKLEKLAFVLFEQALRIAGAKTSRDGQQSSTRRCLRTLRAIFQGILSRRLIQPTRIRPYLGEHERLLGSLPDDPAARIEYGEPEAMLVAARIGSGDVGEAAAKTLDLYRKAGAPRIRLEEAVEFAGMLLDAAFQRRGVQVATTKRDLDSIVAVADWLAAVDVEQNRSSRRALRLGVSSRLRGVALLLPEDADAAGDLFVAALERMTFRDQYGRPLALVAQPTDIMVTLISMVRIAPEVGSRALDHLADTVLSSRVLTRSFALSSQFLSDYVVRVLEDVASNERSREFIAHMLEGRRSVLHRRPGRPRRPAVNE